MNKNKHIPQGYKDSPLGIIPKEWEVKRLGELCTKIGSGVTPRGGQNVYLSQGRPFMRSQNVANGYLLLDDVVFIDERTHQKQKSTEIELDDVLLSITGASIGRSAIATSEIVGGNVNQHVCIIRLKDKTLSYYICTFLLSYIGQKQIDSYQAGGNREGLNYDQIASFKICIPSSNEIIQIWNCLSLWDTAIEKKSKLIEKLKLCKRGLMQQLLTGKKRLPGFSGEWKEVKLGDIFDERNETKYNDLPLLSITGDKGVIYQSESDKRDISNDDKSKYKRICPNDIGYNTMRMWQGRSALSNIEGIVSPAYTIVTPHKNVDVRFMAMLIQQPRIIYDFWTHSQGLVSDTLNCKYPDFCQVKVRIPSKEEQTAIADMLYEFDKEINLANEKLASLHSQKRGLMQQLLTGKKRLIL